MPGGPGMGKTTLALAAAYDKRVKDEVRRRANVRRSAGRKVGGGDAARAGERARCRDHGIGSGHPRGRSARTRQAPTLAILDNLETPWHAEADEQRRSLGQLAGIDGLRLVSSLCAARRPVFRRRARLGDVARPGTDEPRRCFCAIAGNQFATDPHLPTCSLRSRASAVDRPDGGATDGRHELGGLVEEWQTRAAVLARGKADDRLTSVRVSLGFSLDRLRPMRKRLLGLVALLPAGCRTRTSRRCSRCGGARAQSMHW